MPNCKYCGEEIESLEIRTHGTRFEELVVIGNSVEINTASTEFFQDEFDTEIYLCPECDMPLFVNYNEAVEFLKPKERDKVKP